jgi:hypothetical protein
VLLYPKPRTGTIRVHYALPVSAFDSRIVKRLDIKDEPGRFCSKTGNLDREGIAIAAEVLASFLNRGVIDLAGKA